MKRSARIHLLARRKKENSCDLFDSALPTNQLNELLYFQEETVCSSPDVSDTDSNYTPPVQNTSSDESCLYNDKTLDQACSFGNVPHASEEFHQDTYSLLEPKLLSHKNIEEPLNLETSIICNDRGLIPWTAEQKKICTTFFKFHIKNKQPPKRHECEALKEKHRDLLINKDWLKIKVFIQNTYTKK